MCPAMKTVPPGSVSRRDNYSCMVSEITRDVKQSTDFPAVTDGEDWRILSAESHRVGFQGKSSACLTSRGIAEYPADVEDVNTAVP